MSARFLLLSSLIAIAGCRAEPEGIAPPGHAGMKLVVDDPQLLEGPAHARLHLPTARHLLARIQLPTPLNRVDWITVQLISPDGAVHATRHLPCSLDSTIKEVASPDGVPHPIDVLPAQAVPGGWTVDVAFPVGGTHLQRRPRPGLWRVRAWLDARPDLPAESTIEFAL